MVHIKKCLLILVLLLAGFVTNAQHKAFQFGFTGGLNLGWYATNAEGYSNDGAKLGGSWGFVADFFIMEGYSFSTGFNVLYINGKMSYPYRTHTGSGSTEVNGTIFRDLNTRYVQLPLVLTMKTKTIKQKVRIFGQVGFGLGFLLSANSNDTFVPENGDENTVLDQQVRDDFRLTRESLILGAGVEIPIHGSTYIRTGVKFDNAFVNVLKGDNSLDPEIKNNGRNNIIEIFAAVIF